jgi:hypothetical protein
MILGENKSALITSEQGKSFPADKMISTKKMQCNIFAMADGALPMVYHS